MGQFAVTRLGHYDVLLVVGLVRLDGPSLDCHLDDHDVGVKSGVDAQFVHPFNEDARGIGRHVGEYLLFTLKKSRTSRTRKGKLAYSVISPQFDPLTEARLGEKSLVLLHQGQGLMSNTFVVGHGPVTFRV